MAEKDPAVTPAEIAIFQAYVDLINAERAAMWARHNTLLVANSLILSALAIAPTHRWADLALLAAGLLSRRLALDHPPWLGRRAEACDNCWRLLRLLLRPVAKSHLRGYLRQGADHDLPARPHGDCRVRADVCVPRLCPPRRLVRRVGCEEGVHGRGDDMIHALLAWSRARVQQQWLRGRLAAIEKLRCGEFAIWNRKHASTHLILEVARDAGDA